MVDTRDQAGRRGLGRGQSRDGSRDGSEWSFSMRNNATRGLRVSTRRSRKLFNFKEKAFPD
jgi:hypothetical protein